MEKKDCGNDKEICMVNYIILNKKNVPPGKGYLTSSVFFHLGKEFDIKWPKMPIPQDMPSFPTLGLNIDWCITFL